MTDLRLNHFWWFRYKIKNVILNSAFLVLLAFIGCTSSEGEMKSESNDEVNAMSRIAFVSKRDGNWEIYVMNADGSSKKNITNNEALDSHPSWSSKDSRIVFSSDRDGDREIFVVDSDGSNIEQLTDNQYTDHMPAWSPDGSKIAFVSDREDRPTLWVMESDGSNPVNLTPKQVNIRWPAWSPDSTRIVYEHNSAIHVIEYTGDNVKRIVRDRKDIDGFFVGWPDWRPDGHKIAVTMRYGLRGAPPSVYFLDPDGENMRPLRRKPGTLTEERPTYSPDGKYIGFSSYGEGNESDIFIAEIGKNTRIKLTDDPALDGFPSWEKTGFVPDYSLLTISE
tara:strand:+ start:35647 stop:36654 length:1008 start_codon:yes stop_codon:yes gene_type:complete